jgi:transmembrane sensor
MKAIDHELQHEAARWRINCDQGLSEHEAEQFARWLEDPQHAEAFAGTDKTWDDLDRLARSSRATSLRKELLASRKPARWPWLSAALAAAAVIAVAYAAWWRPNHFHGDLTTQVGEISRLELPDGSVAQLNTNSVVSVQFSPTVRRIELLRGEAHFAVAKNPERPFTVQAGEWEVRAVGTAFEVKYDAGTVEVLVTEGRVRMTQRGASNAMEPQFLDAGQRAVVSDAQRAVASPVQVATVPASEIERELSWRQQRLVFVSTPLSEIVGEFNRYQTRKIVVADAELALERFGGTFETKDLETFLQLLELNPAIDVERGVDRIVLRRTR